ncbi:MAG: bifunctional 3-(3-hydroxy-phenyl)propionate/3-hydroxycinnamic acid hydroxylase [Burkholderiales bacterium]|nr:MAG: bifunctional 3-(3-hydroxy-phenyl)propionate/3-hydroxycinnamic acid hydroxylase [Burkholderiales bacterium]
MDCDVAILGCGPVGATLANQLGAAGLDVVVIERDAQVFPLPRAIHFDGETMRIFQSLGLRAEVEAISRPGTKGMQFVNAEDRVLMVRAGTAAEGPQGGANNHYFHQPELEVVLRAGLARYPNVRLLAGREAMAVEADAAGVRIVLDDGLRDGIVTSVTNGPDAPTDPQAASDAAAPTEVRARWLVGCDGGRSMVRRAIGSTNEDLGLHQPWLVFDAILERELDLPDYTVQRCDPARPMTMCCVTGQRRRWEIMLMPGDDPEAIARPENVWPLISRWVTPADARLERSAVYTFHSVIARGWRRGRLLIAGDAAHQTPPFLGQGLCAGIRDCVNLAWKLVRVVRGTAPDTLLDTYEPERRPHVQAFIELAVRLGAVIQATDPAVAAERDARFLAGEAQVFEYPQPGLGPGQHAGALGGTLFPQPRLPDGRRLDEALGDAFAVLGDAAAIDAVDAATRERWRAAGAVVLRDPGDAVAAWWRTRGMAAVVLRPDRYLLGAARDAGELAAVSALMA